MTGSIRDDSPPAAAPGADDSHSRSPAWNDRHPGSPDPELSDEELVDRARRGDTEAFGALIRRYFDRVFGLVTKTLKTWSRRFSSGPSGP